MACFSSKKLRRVVRMLWIASFRLKAGDKSLYVNRIIEATDADKAKEIAEKKALINTYWDHPEVIWEFERIIPIDNRRAIIVDNERDVVEGLAEIAEREDLPDGLTTEDIYQAIRKYINETVSPIF